MRRVAGIGTGIVTGRAVLVPTDPTTANYAALFDSLDFVGMFPNSLVVAVAVAVAAGNLLFCSILGYALAKLEFRGRRAVFALVLAALMVPGLVTFVPLYVLTTDLGLTDSLLGLILPFLAAPFGVFLMRQFIGSLPDELIDAARVDGCGELAIFARIILPLTRPALATLGIISFLGSWNNFLWPLVVAQNEEQYTLPVGLALVSSGQDFTRYGVLLAGAPTAQVWVTTADGSRKLAVETVPFNSTVQPIDIRVDASSRGQRFTGAGASVTEASAHLVQGRRHQGPPVDVRRQHQPAVASRGHRHRRPVPLRRPPQRQVPRRRQRLHRRRRPPLPAALHQLRRPELRPDRLTRPRKACRPLPRPLAVTVEGVCGKGAA